VFAGLVLLLLSEPPLQAQRKMLLARMLNNPATRVLRRVEVEMRM
jgi:hypothetical protein